MSKETKNSKNSAEQEAKRARQLIKRRLLGALIVFGVAFILWQVGDELPPQPVFRDVPEVPDNLLTSTKSGGGEDAATVVEREEETTAETPAATVVTAETTENDKVQVATVTPVTSSVIEKTGDTAQNKPVESEEAQKTEKIEQIEKSEEVAKTEAVEETEKPKQTAAADSSGSLLRFQAGAFKDVKNANILAKKLAAQDLSTQIETVGEWHRLYVVDLPDAAALAAAQATVKQVTAERQITDKKPAEKSAAEKFVLQVGAFGQGERSRRTARRLKKEGFTVQLKPVDKDGQKLIRVRVLVSGQRADAEAARARLIKLGYEQTKIID